VDDFRRSIVSCEHDLAAYPVDENGSPVTAIEDTWLPEEHWFILADGAWKLDQLYRGTHDCGQFDEAN
jgi:hypothetical protein